MKFRDTAPEKLTFPETQVDEPIWLFWNTGLDKAPEIVRTCYQSIKKYAGRQVVLLTENLGALMDVENTGMAGAAIMQFGAAWGFLPLIVVAWWIFYPVLKFYRKRYVAVLYIFMYINTVLAQSDLFYPVLIMIPIGLYSLHCFDTTYFAISNDRKEHARI